MSRTENNVSISTPRPPLSQVLHLVLVLMGMLLLYAAPAFASADGRIQGKVIDVLTGDPLPGANVVVKGTVLGAASGLDGTFTITRVPVGDVVLTVTFLGYNTLELPVIVREGQSTNVDVQLEPMVVEGEEVVVSVQAQGQRAAINQQVASLTAKNVVSAIKIQELPESNAAEAVGRLPGVTLEREGGEGTKVVIRGLSPRYSKIQMEGVSLSSTDAGDRSTDLSMISSYMLDGIEVTKAATPNQEADQLGGTVNFKLREAPDQPALNVILQGGYNNLRNEAGDYKIVVSGSRRFLNNKLGVFANMDLDRVNRGDNSVFAGYEIRGDTLAIANSTSFFDTDRVKNRYGGSVVLDYRLPSTQFKFFTMYNQVNEDETQFQEIINPAATTHRFFLDDSRDELSMMTSSFRVDHLLGNIKLSGGVSYNFSRREVPNGVQMNAQENNAFPTNFSHATPTNLNGLDGFLIDGELGFLHPREFVRKSNNDLDATFVEWIFNYDSELFQNQYAADLNARYEFQVSDNFNADLEIGGKYKRQFREFDLNSFEHPMWWVTQDIVRDTWFDELEGSPLIEGYIPSDTNFPATPFVDSSFSPEDFFDGQLNRILDVDRARKFIEMIPRTDEGFVLGMQRNFNTSVPNDYDGDENYYAAYAMPILKIGRKLTLIPGFRYEHNQTEYSGVRTQALGQWDEPFAFDEVRHTRKNSFLLPMLHLRYNVTDGFDVRASYTETLSRPSFNLLIPSWILTNPTVFAWNNPDLLPIESDNYDLSFSLYSSKIGLFTVGGFYKNISNFIFSDRTFVVEEDQLLDAYPDVITTGATVFGFVNNPNDATLYGTELEWQSNFWFLPGALSGLVFGINYTYTFSELIYPQTNPLFERVGFARRLVGSEDSSYEDRLIDQPDHALNITLGFDYSGLSIRGSMRMKSGVFRATNFFPELRQQTEALTLFDLSVSQKLPVQGLNLFLNASNVTEAIDTNTNQGTGWASSQQFYGLTGQAGVRYKF